MRRVSVASHRSYTVTCVNNRRTTFATCCFSAINLNGMFSLRQLVEKRLEKQGQMALAFVDLEKAFDTVPRRMAMTTLRWMGAPESLVKMIEAMYENTKERVASSRIRNVE